MSEREKLPERSLQAGAASGVLRRYLQPLIGGRSCPSWCWS